MEIGRSWTFKTDDVAKNFDEHVKEQLSWYDMLSSLVVIIARHFMPENALCYDIGASTGNFGARLKDEIEDRNIRWIGIDNSENMRKFYKAPGLLVTSDAVEYEYDSFDLAICFLSLMFMPYSKRRGFLDNLISKIKPGGGLIVVDKYEPSGSILSLAFQRFIFQSKLDSGATPENILKKELSLCGIQRPIPTNFFDNYKSIEFFRFGLFFGRIFENQAI